MNFTQLLPLPIAEPLPLVRPQAGGKYTVAAELPATLRSAVRIQDQRRATVLSEERDRVDLYEWVVGSLVKAESLPLPQDLYATDVVVKGTMIFVCGGYRWPAQSDELIVARRIDGGDWFPLDIPKPRPASRESGGHARARWQPADRGR